MDEFAARRINYLRLSVTDRCNLRCVYCTSWQDWRKLPAGEILRYEELLRLAAIGAHHGIAKVRVTGGEPLVRRGVVDFIRQLHRIPGIAKVCLTTNGVLLPELAPALFETGLRHLNISLDTLQRERYRRITGRDDLPAVLAGLERAAALGFHPVKLNCVVLKGINDDEVLDLARLAQDRPFQVRFIELMPAVSQAWWRRHFWPMKAVRRRLSRLGQLIPADRETTAGPAVNFHIPGFQGEIGFISTRDGHQCPRCNRLRLTADGKLKPCLLAPTEFDLKSPARLGLGDGSLANLFEAAMAHKFNHPGASPDLPLLPGWPMVSVGG